LTTTQKRVLDCGQRIALFALGQPAAIHPGCQTDWNLSSQSIGCAVGRGRDQKLLLGTALGVGRAHGGTPSQTKRNQGGRYQFRKKHAD